jgi:phosphinothricin acetyltransferase
MKLVVRDALATDAVACAAIYAPYVERTAVTFETTPPDAVEMGIRIDRAQRSHAWLVVEIDGRVGGYAYGGPFAGRRAYRYSCEVSIYLEEGRRRTGAGRTLYSALLERLTALGYFMALGGMALPNAASVGLHRSLGFTPVGTYRKVGWKLGGWHDVAWMQRTLATGTPETR